MGERVVRNDEVRGSIPLDSTNKFNFFFKIQFVILSLWLCIRQLIPHIRRRCLARAVLFRI